MTPNQFMFQAYLAHRLLPHGDRPTALHVRIARLLARWQTTTPSHAKLARAARCCPRTVQNALNRFRGLGLLSWCHRRRLTRWSGWLRLANGYLFDAPFSLFHIPLREKVLNPKSTLGKLSPEALQALRVKYGLPSL